MKVIKKMLVLVALILIVQPIFSQPNQGAVIPTGKKFQIQSAMNYNRDNGGYWDIPGKPTTIEKGSNIQVWNLDDGIDRFFTLIESEEQGFYEIQIGNTSNSRVDISRGATDNGTNVQVWEKNNNNAQRFLFEHLGNGRFKIHDRNGRVLCLKDRSSNNGSNIHIWGNHDGVWMEWHLIDPDTKKAFIPTKNQPVIAKVKGEEMPEGTQFFIQSAMNYGRDNRGYWDLPGSGTAGLVKGKLFQVWTLDGGPDRLMHFSKANNGQYYKIYVGGHGNNKLVVDLKGAKTDNGTNAHVWEAHNGQSQDFYFVHLGDGRFKIHHRSGKILNLKAKKNDNGTEVHLWDDHSGIWNEWYLIDSETKEVFIPGKTKGKSRQ